MFSHTGNMFKPNAIVDRAVSRGIIAGWIAITLIGWMLVPSESFLPNMSATLAALHDLWFYQNLGINLLASLKLNIEAIIMATTVSLSLSYLGTIALARPLVAFIGQLRFLSFAGMGFAFTLMIRDGYQRKIAVLTFMVTVYFVVSMMDVIAQIPQEQYDLARTLKMGSWETLWEIVIFGQLDQAILVLRQTAAMSWMFIGTAETMDMSGGGIGMMLENSNRHFHLAEIMAMQIIVLMLGLTQDKLIAWSRLQICPWIIREGR